MKIDITEFENDDVQTFVKTKKTKPSTFKKVDRKRLKTSNRKPKHNK